MTAVSDYGVKGERRRATLSVSETHWGYIVSETVEPFDRETVTEAVMRALGLGLLIVAYGLWLLPAGPVSDEVLLMKLAMSVVLTVFGGSLYWLASRGFRSEWQVDTARREIRMASRNVRGNSRLVTRIPMDQIESAFVKRGQSGSHMFFRLRGIPDPMHVLSGSEADLRAFYERLRTDLRPPRDRVEARLAMTGQTQVTPRRPVRHATA